MAQFSELVGKSTDVLTVRRVFGEPIEREGVTVIPVARIRGAWGGGSGPSPTDADAAATGLGGGGGHSASPAGVYVIKDGTVRWLPADDPGKAIVWGCAVAIVGLLVARSIAGKAFARAR